MDKNNKVIPMIVCVILAANLWTTFSMKRQVNELETQVFQMQSQLQNAINNIDAEIYSLREEVLDKIGQGESLLSDYETTVDYKDGQLECTVRVVPKEINEGELVYLAVGGEKKLADSFNGYDYAATFPLAPAKGIVPVVSFEALAGTRQEALPELVLDEYLSLGFDSNLDMQEEGKALLTLMLYIPNEKSSFLLEAAPSVTAIIKDASTGAELDRVDMYPDSAGLEIQKGITYLADFIKYMDKEGSYSISAEITTKGGLLYRAELASISMEGKGSYMGSNGRTGTVTPVW